MPSMSRRGFAKTRNISEASVRKHIASGVLADALRPDGTLDADKADAALAGALTRPRAAHAPPVLRLARGRHTRALVRRQRDELARLRENLITPAADAALDAASNAAVARVLSEYPATVAPLVAGRPAAEAHRVLSRELDGFLERAGTAEADEVDIEVRPSAPEVDLDRLSPVQLQALKLNQAAEVLELQRSLARGDLRWIEELDAEYIYRQQVAKSLFVALPGRVAQAVSVATVEQAEAIIAAEIEQVVASLGPVN